MKRLFAVLVIVLLTLTLSACNIKENKENKELVAQTKVDVLNIIAKFGEPEDVDVTFDTNDTYPVGHAHLFSSKEGEDITLVIAEDTVLIMFNISLQESTRGVMLVDEVYISYVDTSTNTTVDLTYYVFDDGLFGRRDFSAIEYKLNFYEVSEGVSLFDMLDIQYLLRELGYKEIK